MLLAITVYMSFVYGWVHLWRANTVLMKNAVACTFYLRYETFAIPIGIILLRLHLGIPHCLYSGP
jgi:hypothetical protein